MAITCGFEATNFRYAYQPLKAADKGNPKKGDCSRMKAEPQPDSRKLAVTAAKPLLQQVGRFLRKQQPVSESAEGSEIRIQLSNRSKPIDKGEVRPSRRMKAVRKNQPNGA